MYVLWMLVVLVCVSNTPLVCGGAKRPHQT